MKRLGLTLLLLFGLLIAPLYGAQFTLSWTDNSTNEAGFRIERATGLAATTGFTEIATVGANIVTYVDAGLPNSTSYSYRLRAYNAAGNSGYSNTASGTTPPPANTVPTISNITDRSINKNANTGAIAFVIGDTETAAASLIVAGTSSNLSLVPNANIVFGGSGANRTVTVTPIANQVGTTTITVTVNDESLTSSDTFVLTVLEILPTVPTNLILESSF